MKIRWSRHSVRMRITPTELAALQQGETVTEELAAPGGSWTASIATGTASSALTMQGSALQITVSPSDLARLLAPENEGVYFGDETVIRYYIEKDFPCAHPRAVDVLEPASETFAPTPAFTERSKNQC